MYVCIAQKISMCALCVIASEQCWCMCIRHREKETATTSDGPTTKALAHYIDCVKLCQNGRMTYVFDCWRRYTPRYGAIRTIQPYIQMQEWFWPVGKDAFFGRVAWFQLCAVTIWGHVLTSLLDTFFIPKTGAWFEQVRRWRSNICAMRYADVMDACIHHCGCIRSCRALFDL